MGVGTVAQVMARIKVATPNSPISVFIQESKQSNGSIKRELDAHFTNSVGAIQRKNAIVKPTNNTYGMPTWAYEWIGDYNGWQNQKTIRALLIQALRK
jgi:hypothetical protein